MNFPGASPLALAVHAARDAVWLYFEPMLWLLGRLASLFAPSSQTRPRFTLNLEKGVEAELSQLAADALSELSRRRFDLVDLMASRRLRSEDDLIRLRTLQVQVAALAIQAAAGRSLEISPELSRAIRELAGRGVVIEIAGTLVVISDDLGRVATTISISQSGSSLETHPTR